MTQTSIRKQYQFGKLTLDFTPTRLVLREKNRRGVSERHFDIAEIDLNYMINRNMPVAQIVLALVAMSYGAYIIGGVLLGAWSLDLIEVSSLVFLIVCSSVGVWRNFTSEIVFRNSYRSGDSFTLPYKKQYIKTFEAFLATLIDVKRGQSLPLNFIPDLLAHYGIIGRKEYLRLKGTLATGAIGLEGEMPREKKTPKAKILPFKTRLERKLDEPV